MREPIHLNTVGCCQLEHDLASLINPSYSHQPPRRLGGEAPSEVDEEAGDDADRTNQLPPEQHIVCMTLLLQIGYLITLLIYGMSLKILPNIWSKANFQNQPFHLNAHFPTTFPAFTGTPSALP